MITRTVLLAAMLIALFPSLTMATHDCWEGTMGLECIIHPGTVTCKGRIATITVGQYEIHVYSADPLQPTGQIGAASYTLRLRLLAPP